ncbi:MAG TPA: DUF1566 domain-containing protein [Polyangiales bacterium]|nr:DUF1566 domain-containing protein [Polyangiales bacterium]
MTRGTRLDARGLWLLLASCVGALSACASEVTSATQLLVTVHADANVAARLRAVKASSYPTGAKGASNPYAQISFALGAESSGAQPVSLPLSFGVQPGKEDAFILVVEGYTSAETTGQPSIESKVAVRYVRGKSTPIDVLLNDVCFATERVCSGVERTCYAVSVGSNEAGECGPVGDAAPGFGNDPSIDRSDAQVPRETPDAASSIPEDSGLQTVADANALVDAGMSMPDICAGENVCLDPAYPCVSSGGADYLCLGQLAEWHMPDSTFGSKYAPDYAVDVAAGLVTDRVTGLVWERDLPTSYAGCGTPGPSGPCTWQEARAYCAQLALDGKQWRLPSMIELLSLVDVRADEPPAIGRTAFPDRSKAERFWTASPSTVIEGNAWNIGFGRGDANVVRLEEKHWARCVHGVPTRPGTPLQRYEVIGDAILDRRTELTWQRTLSGVEVDHASASRYCAGLGNDYRLPTYKELMTLVDPTLGNIPLARELPRLGDNAWFWTSSPSVQQADSFWLVGLGAGGVGLFESYVRLMMQDPLPPGAPPYVFRAWCVR